MFQTKWNYSSGLDQPIGREQTELVVRYSRKQFVILAILECESERMESGQIIQSIPNWEMKWGEKLAALNADWTEEEPCSGWCCCFCWISKQLLKHSSFWLEFFVPTLLFRKWSKKKKRRAKFYLVSIEQMNVWMSDFSGLCSNWFWLEICRSK